MIKAILCLSIMSLASVSFASTCDTQLTLNCRAVYQPLDGSGEVREVSSSFADEHWDEPSLANCASTAYINEGNTVVRIYATKSLENYEVKVTAGASQTIKHFGRGSMTKKTEYSNLSSAKTVVGKEVGLEALQLPKLLNMGNIFVKDIYVTCEVR